MKGKRIYFLIAATFSAFGEISMSSAADDTTLRQKLLALIDAAGAKPPIAAPGDVRHLPTLLPTSVALWDTTTLQARGIPNWQEIAAAPITELENILPTNRPTSKEGAASKPESPKPEGVAPKPDVVPVDPNAAGTPPRNKSTLEAIGDKLKSPFASKSSTPEPSSKGSPNAGRRTYFPASKDWASDNGWVTLSSKSSNEAGAQKALSNVEFSYKLILIAYPGTPEEEVSKLPTSLILVRDILVRGKISTNELVALQNDSDTASGFYGGLPHTLRFGTQKADGTGLVSQTLSVASGSIVCFTGPYALAFGFSN